MAEASPLDCADIVSALSHDENGTVECRWALFSGVRCLYTAVMWRLFCGIIFLIAGACHWRANGEVPAGEVTVSKAFAERQAERDRMVREQLKSRDIVHDGVLRAMAKVPRHALVPTQHQTFAYRDHPLPIGEGQTISQPYIVSFMTQAYYLQA